MPGPVIFGEILWGAGSRRSRTVYAAPGWRISTTGRALPRLMRSSCQRRLYPPAGVTAQRPSARPLPDWTKVRAFRPQSVAIAGCAGGNGIVRIATMGVNRIAGIDVNAEYLAAVHRRLGSWMPGLELHLADIQTGVPDCAPVELVFAGLILEYVEVAATLQVLRALCAPGGALVIVLQRSSDTKPAVSKSPYTSLQALASVLQLRDPDAVTAAALLAGFSEHSRRCEVLESGKAFEILSFRA